MNEVTVGIVSLVLLLLFFLTGIELGFAMAVIGFLGFAHLDRAPRFFRHRTVLYHSVWGAHTGCEVWRPKLLRVAATEIVGRG